MTACVRVPGAAGGREPHLAEFATTVRGLLALRDWLAAHRVTQVAMEATGVYWKPVWHILEDDFELMLVNARHVKQVPGRKTDVSDARGCASWPRPGCCGRSFVPPKPIRDCATLTRYRKTQIAERQREANRLHKALEDTGIKLDCVASDILGVSGRAMLDALVAGTTDPEVLAELAKGRLRRRSPRCSEALEGRFDGLHALLIGAILAHLDFLDEQIDRLSDAIEEQIAPFGPAVELLCTIPGVQQRTAESDRRRDRHRHERLPHRPPPRLLGRRSAPATTSPPASAAPAGPARAPSGSTPRSRTPRWPRSAPTTATSHALIPAPSAPGIGHGRALGAVKHSILVACWHMLTTGELYRDLGGDYFHRRDPERPTKRLVAQLEALGHTVTLQEAAA